MRTREEQISHLSCAIFNKGLGDIGNYISLARDHILEAERRAEQRVRDEIGKDSERLDWLATQFRITSVNMSGDPIYSPSRLLYNLKGQVFREAIDAAREVG